MQTKKTYGFTESCELNQASLFDETHSVNEISVANAVLMTDSLEDSLYFEDLGGFILPNLQCEIISDTKVVKQHSNFLS